MARKTHTSTEVKQRWIKANYKRFHVSLRYDTDQHLIDFIEKRKTSTGVTDIIREALEALIEKENK